MASAYDGEKLSQVEALASFKTCFFHCMYIDSQAFDGFDGLDPLIHAKIDRLYMIHLKHSLNQHIDR